MHGGNLNKIAETYQLNKKNLIDFSVSLNPLGFPENTRKIISRNLEHLVTYPDPDYMEFRSAIASFEKQPLDHIVQGNGSSELLLFILILLKPDTLLLPVPSYIDYEKYAVNQNLNIEFIALNQENNFQLPLNRIDEQLNQCSGRGALLIGIPNNPTGTVPEIQGLYCLTKKYPQHYFILDMAYSDMCDLQLDFFKKESCIKNIIQIKSLTKLLALPGLRTAYSISSVEIAEKLKNLLPAWNMNSLAAKLSSELLQDQEYLQKTKKTIHDSYNQLYLKLKTFQQIKVFPGTGNFILFSLLYNDPSEFYEFFLKHNLVLRWCRDYQGLGPRYFRIGIRNQEDNLKLLSSFDQYFSSRPRVRGKGKKYPVLMFVGTSSNAGKSLLNAAYCRVLSDLGYKVAPFKAQNMSLNSAVTSEGGEIGRAQALQARAARTEMHTDMNPVLLKPHSDIGSQVILNGRVWDSLKALDYYAAKEKLVPEVHNAYERLAARYDVIVMEGAGSPGEVNLKKHDMVNMAMARYAASNVVLVGDIDRGGVYASFIGHMEVMAQWERSLVKGFLVNKFRGDARLLKEAHDYVMDFTGKPVVGVMPYVRDHRLPEEDGVDFQERYGFVTGNSKQITIGVIELPHISNSTDIDPLLDYPECGLIKIRSVDDFYKEKIHLLIIPGTKNVISDLKYLKNNGLADCIVSEFESGDLCILGICGGFQILGQEIHDPLGIESVPGSRENGLGLLDATTELAREKSLFQRSSRCHITGTDVEGYEIHHGLSQYQNELFTHKGLGTWNHRIWGTYLHGVLENPVFLEKILEETVRAHNLSIMEFQSSHFSLDKALDGFAKYFKDNVDITFLLKATGL